MKLPYAFYHRPCLEVAHDLVGKVLVCGDQKLRISETEAYVGESDTACHAHKGRTKRTEVMYREAGTIYITCATVSIGFLISLPAKKMSRKRC